MMTQNTLAKTPIKYEDFIVSDGTRFTDDFSRISAASFRDTQVTCPCHASNKPFRNKATFKTHCNSKKHQAWLLSLSKKHDDIIKNSIERAGEIRDLRIRLEKLERKNTRLEKDIAQHDKEKRDLKYAHQEELEEITAERDHLREQHEWEKKKVGGLRLRLSDFEKWLKRGAVEIMDWEIPESDDEL